MPHLLDIRPEGLDVPEEGAELRTPAEPLQMPFGRIPLDPQHIAGGVFCAACQFIRQTVGRGEERLACQAVRPFELDTPCTRESVSDVLDDHRKHLSASARCPASTSLRSHRRGREQAEPYRHIAAAARSSRLAMSTRERNER